RPGLVRAAILQREDLVILGAEDRDRAAGRGHGARPQPWHLIQRPHIPPAGGHQSVGHHATSARAWNSRERASLFARSSHGSVWANCWAWRKRACSSLRPAASWTIRLFT